MGFRLPFGAWSSVSVFVPVAHRADRSGVFAHRHTCRNASMSPYIMRELNIVVGIILGVFANMAILLGASLHGLGRDYGSKIGGLVFIIGAIVVWALPAIQIVSDQTMDEPGVRTSMRCSKWINGIFLVLACVGIAQIAII